MKDPEKEQPERERKDICACWWADGKEKAEQERSVSAKGPEISDTVPELNEDLSEHGLVRSLFGGMYVCLLFRDCVGVEEWKTLGTDVSEKVAKMQLIGLRASFSCPSS